MAATNLTDGGTTSGLTSSNTASVSPAADALILMSICAYDSADNLTAVDPTVTGGGMTTWSLITSNLFDSTAADYAKLWVFRAQQASPGSAVATIDFGAVNVSRFSWSIDQFTDMVVGSNGADAIVQTATNAGASGALNLTGSLAAFASPDNTSFGAFGVQTSNPATFTVGAGYAELGQFNTSTSFAQILTEFVVGDDDPDASWTAVSVFKSGVIAIELAAAPTPPATPGAPQVLLARHAYGGGCW